MRHTGLLRPKKSGCIVRSSLLLSGDPPRHQVDDAVPVLDFNFGIHAVHHPIFAVHQLKGIAQADFIRFGVELQLHRQQMICGNAA